MNLTLADVQRCASGLGDETLETVTVTGVQTDSRLVEPGDLFICLIGDNFDGHSFAAQAVAQGAVGVVASAIVDVDAPVIMVRDTVEAMGRIAACWRDKCGATLIAVTGTAGKTTVKEMLYAVISRRFHAAKNYRNHNNQIGLPLSMLKATCEQPVWIMELGISIKGDMEELAIVAQPDLAVITNVGPGHLEGLGDEEGVAEAKTTLLRYLRDGGRAVVSRDYPLLWDKANRIVSDPLGFTAKAHGDTSYVASFLGVAEEEGWGRFLLRTPEGEGEFLAPFTGDHFAENLACVAAVADCLGLDMDDVVGGVQSLTADHQRFCCKTRGDCVVIDDTYNANPLSMARSIQTAARMAEDRPLALVLGDMRELGDETVMRHEELGRFIRDAAPSVVFYKGDHRADVARGYGGDIIGVNTMEDFLYAWRETGLDNAVILVKGSRSLKMEELANGLCKSLANTAG